MGYNIILTDLQVQYLLRLVDEEDKLLKKDKSYRAYSTHHKIREELIKLNNIIAIEQENAHLDAWD